MQHAEVFFSFVVIVVLTAFIVVFLLYGRLVRLIIHDWVVQCGLQALAEILKVLQGSGRGLKILNLHLLLLLDWDSEL